MPTVTLIISDITKANFNNCLSFFLQTHHHTKHRLKLLFEITHCARVTYTLVH